MEHVLVNFRSRPLTGRGKAKELRYNFFSEIIASGVERKSVSSGGTFWLGCLVTGMADALHLGGEIYGAFRGSHLTFTQRPDEVKVSACYSANSCTPTRGYFSSIPSGNGHFSGIFSPTSVPFMRFRRRSHSERSNVVPVRRGVLCSDGGSDGDNVCFTERGWLKNPRDLQEGGCYGCGY